MTAGPAGIRFEVGEGSIIVPAHNESKVIGRLLSGVLDARDGDWPELAVVCNGCVDDTAAIARTYPGARVFEIAKPSKHAAILEGERHATGFPRVYLDADVEIDLSTLRILFDALDESGGLLAAGPGRYVDVSRSSWPVRAWYRVWSTLPAVQGLQGRGVIVVSEAGHERLKDWPEQMADDLFVATRFAPGEYRIVDGTSITVHAPRHTSDLIRRRVRAVVGNAELGRWSGGTTTSAPSSIGHLVRAYAGRPTQWVDLAVFLTVTVACRLIARTGGRRLSGVWLRDESSRSADA